MTICNCRGRWKRTPGFLRWHSDDLPGWCVTSTFAPDRRGVYRRTFFALYRGMTVGEVYPATTPACIMDALDDLLGHAYRSPVYVSACGVISRPIQQLV